LTELKYACIVRVTDVVPNRSTVVTNKYGCGSHTNKQIEYRSTVTIY